MELGRIWPEIFVQIVTKLRVSPSILMCPFPHTAPTTVIQQIMKALKDGKTLPVHRVPYVAPTQPLQPGFPALTAQPSSTSTSSTSTSSSRTSVTPLTYVVIESFNVVIQPNTSPRTTGLFYADTQGRTVYAGGKALGESGQYVISLIHGSPFGNQLVMQGWFPYESGSYAYGNRYGHGTSPGNYCLTFYLPSGTYDTGVPMATTQRASRSDGGLNHSPHHSGSTCGGGTMMPGIRRL